MESIPVRMTIPQARALQAALRLEIRRGGQFWTYAAESLASDFGTAFRLRRVGGADRDATYDVLLDGPHSDCTCPDAVYRRRECKHLKLAAAFVRGECAAA